MVVTSTVQIVEKLLSVNLASFIHNDGTLFSTHISFTISPYLQSLYTGHMIVRADTMYTLPPHLQDKVQFIRGISNFPIGKHYH